MRSIWLCAGFSLLREFDDERLLPHVNRIRRDALSEDSDVKGSGQEKVEGSGERVARAVDLKEASGEEPKTEEEKVRIRREDEIVAASGQEEGSGETAQKPHIRLRRSVEADEDVKGSGQEVEGSGHA